MKILLQFIGITFCALALTGCEWTTGGGVDSWNEGGNFADFSGSYRASDGGVLVRTFGSSGTNTTYTTNTITSEYLATGDGTLTAFEGQLAYAPVRGSLTIFTAGGYRFTDTAGTTAGTVALAVTPADGAAGTFNYGTRAWALTFPAPLASGTQILVTYQYVSSSSVVTPAQGNHGSAIYTFVVYQTGTTLQFTDSNGATYTGTMGTMRTTGGQPTDTATTGPVVAQFSVTGVSQGYNVTIVGVLQGTLTAGTTLSSRTMQATFIETGGYDANITAVAN